MGYHGVAGNVGMGISPALVGIIADIWSWRGAYALLAFLALALAGWAFLLPVRSISASAGTSSDSSRLHPVGRLSWALAAVYVASVLMGMVYRGTLTFLPTHIHERVSPQLSGSLTTLVLLLGGVGQLAGGLLTRYLNMEWLALAVTAIALPPLLLMGVAEGGVVAFLAAAFIFTNFAHQPIFNTLIADYTPGRFVGRSFGLAFWSTFGMGALGGAVAGVLTDRWDTGVAFLGMGALWALAVVATSFLPLLVRRTVASSVASARPDVP